MVTTRLSEPPGEDCAAVRVRRPAALPCGGGGGVMTGARPGDRLAAQSVNRMAGSLGTFHVLTTDRNSSCGSTIRLLTCEVDAATVAEEDRCQRSGCRTAWPRPQVFHRQLRAARQGLEDLLERYGKGDTVGVATAHDPVTGVRTVTVTLTPAPPPSRYAGRA